MFTYCELLFQQHFCVVIHPLVVIITHVEHFDFFPDLMVSVVLIDSFF